MRKKTWLLFGLLIYALAIGLVPFAVLGDDAQASEAATLYADFLSAKDSMQYEVQTKYRISASYSYLQSIDIHLFCDDYVYHKLVGLDVGDSLNTAERLVVLGADGDRSYFRAYAADPYATSSTDPIPFFQSDAPDVKDAILKFFDNPLFALESVIDASLSGVSLDVSALSTEGRAYLEGELRRMIPSAVVPANGNVTYGFVTDGTAITGVTVDYRDLFDGVNTFSQTITFSRNTTLDVDTLLSGTIDVTGIFDWENTTLPHVDADQSASFQYAFGETAIQYLFLRIETAGEYVFTESDDNNDSNPIWYLFGFDLHQYRPFLTFDNPMMADAQHLTLYFEPGFYILYLMPKRINMQSAELVYTFQGSSDDLAGAPGPALTTVSETSTVTFRTDYAHDVDAFLVTGGYDVVIVEHGVDMTIAVERKVRPLEDWNFLNTFTNPGFDFILYCSSTEVGDHQVRVSYYSYDDTPVPLSEAPVIDLYDDSRGVTWFIALPFRGGEDSFAFDLQEDSDLYAFASVASLRIYDADGVLVALTGLQVYALAAGRYYVNLYDFTGDFAGFTLVPEAREIDLFVLDPADGSMQVEGFVSGYDDVDLYEVTFAVTTTIRFRNGPYERVLLFGMDNPNVYLLPVYTEETFVIPAGTYRLTLPRPMFPMSILPYNFLIEVVSDETGGQS